jgi:hypothetical protein
MEHSSGGGVPVMAKISLILLVALFCGAAHAEDGEGRWAKRLWKMSIAAVAAGSIVDTQSSLGKHETNGLLANRQGVFSMQGIGLKLALAGAAVGTQQYLLHRHPAISGYKTGALINFAVAGTLTGVAVHNYGTRVAQ